MDRIGRVLLIGMGETSLSALESLATSLQVVGLIRQPAPTATSEDPVITRARALDVPVFPDVAPAKVADVALALEPDVVVVSSYDRILKPELLERVRFVNVHYSPLPRYRGRANVNWAIINDEPHTAITIHVIAPGLDAGNILFQQLVPIGPDDTVLSLYDRLNALQREHLAATVIRFLGGDTGVPQREQDATWGCTRVPADGQIDWSAPTRKITRLIRALDTPFPGAHTYLDGRKLKIWKAVAVDQAMNYAGRIPGRVVGRSTTEGHVDVLTGDGVLRLLQVQLDREQRTAAAGVITSVKASLGLDPQDLLERIQHLEHRLAELERRHTAGPAGSKA